MTKTSKRYGFSELVGLFGRLLKPVADAFAAETGRDARSVAAGVTRRLVNQALDAVLPEAEPAATPDVVTIVGVKPIKAKPRLARAAAQIRKPRAKMQPPKATAKAKPRATPPKPKPAAKAAPKATPPKPAAKAAPKVKGKAAPKRKPKGPGNALPDPLPPLFPLDDAPANNGLAPAPRGWASLDDGRNGHTAEKYTVPAGADLG